MLTRCLALELAGDGVRVNAVLPGWVETPGERNVQAELVAKDPDFFRKVGLRSVPLKRMQTPAEIAEAVAFLASDAASSITGTLLPVDGGMGAW